MSQADCKVALDSANELATGRPGVCFESNLRKLGGGGYKSDIAVLDQTDPRFFKHYSDLACQVQMTVKQQEWVYSLFKWMAGVDGTVIPFPGLGVPDV